MEPIILNVINFSAGETDYEFEDADIKQMLVDATALNGQYLVDVS